VPWLAIGKSAHELRDGEIIVGSGSEASWRVPTADLMPRHFVVLVHGLNASVRPFSTETVVVVNGAQVAGAPHTLSDGDVIAAGSAQFAYAADRPPSPPPLAAVAQTAYLVDDGEKKAYPLHNRSTGIGRDASNAILIRDPMASRFHADIRREAGGFVLHARGSAGTLVNKRRIGSPCMLAEGDVVEIAYTTLRFTMQPLAEDVATGPAQAAVDDAFARRLTGTSRRISAPRMTAADRRPRGLAWLVAVIVIATVAWWVWSSWR